MRNHGALVTEHPPRLVIDTNVFVSGLIFSAGSPAHIRRALQSKKAIHLVSDPIVEEYLRVLDYPRIRKFKGITDEFITIIAAYLLYQTERVELASDFRWSPDPEEDIFLETAVDGGANMLVTNDKADLLSLKSVRDIPIVSASQAVKRLRV